MAIWPDGDGVEFQWNDGLGGTGPVAAGAVMPYRRLPSIANDGIAGAYFIRHASENQWEQSIGTWSHSGQTLTRGEGPIVGSNGSSLVSFSLSGTKIVSFVASSDELVALNDLADALAYEPTNF